MAKGSGGSRGGGRLPSGRRLAPGFRSGGAISAASSSFKVGDRVRVSTRSMSLGDSEITKINRKTVDVRAGYMGRTLNMRVRISDLRGGFMQRGNRVFDIN